MQDTVIVVRSFDGHAVGALVTDQNEVTKILSGEHANHVVRIIPPAPATTSKEH